MFKISAIVAHLNQLNRRGHKRGAIQLEQYGHITTQFGRMTHSHLVLALGLCLLKTRMNTGG
jgi:hypothetical protein